MSDRLLTPQQLQVIEALSSGLTTLQAAAQIGIHRNTITNWRRNSLTFSEALSHALYDKAMLHREKAELRVDRAYQALDSILDDPHASPSARLKAATFIIEKASTQPPEKSQIIYLQNYPVRCPESAPSAEPEIVQPEIVHTMHNSAQQPYHREHPKTGRNETCPCGSGQKFKRCCLSKSPPANLAQAA